MLQPPARDMGRVGGVVEAGHTEESVVKTAQWAAIQAGHTAIGHALIIIIAVAGDEA